MGLSSLLLLGAFSVAAEPPLPGPVAPLVTADPVSAEGPVFGIDQFVIDYREPHPDQPGIEKILPITLPLTESGGAFLEPGPGDATVLVQIDSQPGTLRGFHSSALGAIARALLARVNREGLMGVYVRPSAEDIDIEKELDLRPEGDHQLHIEIWVGRIQDVRTLAMGNRIRSNWIVDNPAHRKIRNYSPLHPEVAGYDETTDLLDRRALEDYIHHLNRQPGRHIEAALAASNDQEGITLDYRVYEERPWSVYGQASNTGNERTGLWQGRFGYINRQLTSRDDVLSLQYLYAGGADSRPEYPNAPGPNVNNLEGSYEAPWFAPKRPNWMETSGDEPPWLAWADRNKIPWWGLGRLRWGVAGGWTRIQSNTLGALPGGFDALEPLISSDWRIGGHFRYNAFQYRDFFLDVFIGGRFRGVDLDDEAANNAGQVTLVTGQAGVSFERTNLYSTLHGQFSGERTAPLGSQDDYNRAFGGGLGRASTSPRWWLLKFDAGFSTYLEPLLFRSVWRDPSKAKTSNLSHEIALGGRGQYAFNYRLIPQSSQVVGGMYSVRGFPQGLAVGDSVYVGSFEYRFHIPRALPLQPTPVTLPWIGDFRIAPQQPFGRPDWDFILRAFVDAGRTVRNDPQLASATELNQSLVGAGVGLEFVFKGNLRARVDWAHGVYQNIQCDDLTPSGAIAVQCVNAKANGDIKPGGQFYFLFSGAW